MSTARRPYSDSIFHLLQAAVLVQILSLSLSIALSSIGFGLACLCFIALFFLDRNRVSIRTGLEWYIIAYAFAVLLMCIFALYPSEAWFNSRRVLLIATAYFVPLVLRTENAPGNFIMALGAITALQSIVEIIVYYASAAERLGFLQIYMTSAGIKMIVLLLIIPFAFWERFRSPRRRLLLSFLCVIIFYALILTETRSSWLGFLAGGFLIGVVSYRMLLPILVFVVFAVLVFAPGKTQERIRNMFQTEQVEETATIRSNLNRIRMWETGILIWKDHPILGAGDGNMCHIYRMYTTPDDDQEGCHLHNNFIHLLATHGIVGLGTVLLLFAMIVRKEWRLLRKRKGSLDSIIGAGTLAAFTGFLVSGMAEYNFGDHEILVLLWTTVGLAVTAERLTTGASR